jgi:hypothetical protein
MIRQFAITAAALVLVALPLRAQRADSTVESRVSIPIVVTAEAPERDMRTLSRANRFLERELRRFDAQEARLQARLDSLKQLATARERAIDAMSREAASVRAARLDLEARLQRLEASGSAPRAQPAGGSTEAGRTAGGR